MTVVFLCIFMFILCVVVDALVVWLLLWAISGIFGVVIPFLPALIIYVVVRNIMKPYVTFNK